MDYRTMYDEVPPIGGTRPLAVPRNRLLPAGGATRPLGRRVFLTMLGTGAAGLLVGRQLGPILGAANVFLPADGFRIYTVTPTLPTFDPRTYRLAIGGSVANPQSLSFREIAGLPRLREVRTYHCVTGWSVSNCHWEGVPMRHVVDLVRPAPSARYVNFWSADGAYTESLSLEQAMLPDVMLGYRLNGKPLSTDQGAPLRLVIPEMYGYKYIKWVNRLEFAEAPVQGYWEARGYATDAYIGAS
jgi:DMSO/TMAO reductase YedYZ molybdopterin-dependent catalytic subunit